MRPGSLRPGKTSWIWDLWPLVLSSCPSNPFVPAALQRIRKLGIRKQDFCAGNRLSLPEFSDSRQAILEFFFPFLLVQDEQHWAFKRGNISLAYIVSPPVPLFPFLYPQSPHFLRTCTQSWLRRNWQPCINHLLNLFVFPPCHLFYYHRDSDFIISPVKTTV